MKVCERGWVQLRADRHRPSSSIPDQTFWDGLDADAGSKVFGTAQTNYPAGLAIALGWIKDLDPVTLMGRKEPLPTNESDPVGSPEAVAVKVWNLVESIDREVPGMQWKQPKVHFAVPSQLSWEFDPEEGGQVLKAIERGYFEAPYTRKVGNDVYVAVENGKAQNRGARTSALAAGGLVGVMNAFMCGGE